MPYKVYIDGQAGTTGLQLQEKLSHHDGVELLLIAEEKRKDEAERKRLMNLADVVFLCLPDAAAKEAVHLVETPIPASLMPAPLTERQKVGLTASRNFLRHTEKPSSSPNALPTPAVTPQGSLRRHIHWCIWVSLLPIIPSPLTA